MVVRKTIWKSDVYDRTVNAKLLTQALLHGWLKVVQKAKHFFVVETTHSDYAWLFGSYGIYS